MKQIIENKSKSEYYNYNLYQAYYPVQETEHSHTTLHHTVSDACGNAVSGAHLNSLSDEDRAIILNRISAELGYPEPETEIEQELWS